jgi:hypothetical protein
VKEAVVFTMRAVKVVFGGRIEVWSVPNLTLKAAPSPPLEDLFSTFMAPSSLWFGFGAGERGVRRLFYKGSLLI